MVTRDYEGDAIDWLDTAGMSNVEATSAIARAQVYATLELAQAVRDLTERVTERLEVIAHVVATRK